LIANDVLTHCAISDFRGSIHISGSMPEAIPYAAKVEVRMGESIVLGERRRALRVPVRGVAVLYADGGPLHGMIENLSQSGALVSVASRPPEALDMEIRLSEGRGWVAAAGGWGGGLSGSGRRRTSGGSPWRSSGSTTPSRTRSTHRLPRPAARPAGVRSS